MPERNPLADLIRRARNRRLMHCLVTAASLALAVALAGAVLLLLVGTEILNWGWLIVLFVAGLAAGVYRSRNQILSGYEVAQAIDRRLGFHDALSTACYFGDHAERAEVSREFVQHQRRVAEELARPADIGRGVPFLVPRTFYVNAALAVLAFGMFGLRYGIQRSLDLRPSLVRIAFDGFLGPSRDTADASKGRRPFDSDGRRDNGSSADPWDSNSNDLSAAPDAALDATDSPDASSPDGASGSAKTKATGQEKTPGDDLQESANQQEAPPNNDAGASNSSPDGNSKMGKQPGGKNSSQSGGESENSSLTEKLRDALANLMAKLKPQSNNSGAQPRNSQQPSNGQAGQKQSQPQDGGPKPSNQEQADANSNSDSQGEQQQGGTEQPAQGKSQGASSERPNSPDGKSGIGNQNGDKTAREAAELAAMGKISELIGKRAANVTGEVMVEVSSGKQQLKTRYSQSDASHIEAGGEINRDEIPLAYQQYVQQYFEEIRKAPAAKSKPDAKAKPAGN